MNNILDKTLLCIILFGFFLSGCQSTKTSEIQHKANVAILFPLTGTDGEQGQRLASLVRLGLEDGLQGHINLVTYDAKDEQNTKLMMDKIIANKAQIILGPLLSKTTSYITSQAEKHNITIITLSNNPGLAMGNVYVFGHAPMRQTERVINYFLSHGHKDIILLLPSSNYAKTINAIISDLAIQFHGNVIHTEYYQNTPESIEKSISNVDKIVDDFNETADNTTKPVIYIADDQKALPLLFTSIAKHELDKKAIISGDNRTDIKLPSNIDLIYSGSMNHINYDLTIKASELLGINNLNFMDYMAYDLGRMTAYYIGTDFNYREFLERLRSKDYYQGASGNVIFNDNIAIRKYDIIKRTSGEYKTIDRNT